MRNEKLVSGKIGQLLSFLPEESYDGIQEALALTEGEGAAKAAEGLSEVDRRAGKAGYDRVCSLMRFGDGRPDKRALSPSSRSIAEKARRAFASDATVEGKDTKAYDKALANVVKAIKVYQCGLDEAIAECQRKKAAEEEKVKEEQESSSPSSLSEGSESDGEHAADKAAAQAIESHKAKRNLDWPLMAEVKARNVVLVQSRGDRSLMKEMDKAFDQALLFDGFSAKFPEGVNADFEAFSKVANTVDGSKLRQKFVRDKPSEFSQVMESKDWTAQDEVILRESFWAASLYAAHGKEFIQKVEGEGDSKSERNILIAKLFKTRYMAYKSDFQFVGILARHNAYLCLTHTAAW
ncbi:unnamed protein product [Durusdinium trenchii]|uniref:Uncharacterized protein n=2 Tax=Durusdinium trenchii TaxID=1381693 RepID=A0ABP0PCK4_9DINO